jgi:benzil reductase ((S)-benzoin forming)
MNQTVYITGTSKGIGAALADYYLKTGSDVVGIARSHKHQHPYYTGLQVDLSDEHALQNFEFPDPKPGHRLVLINNAGALGPMHHAGNLNPTEILSSFRLNISAPLILINRFIAQFGTSFPELKILNMSSGAGVHPYDGWSIYCASKAAVNMLTEVVRAELSVASKTHIHCLALAPGIIETDMQHQIRASSPQGFSLQPLFVEFKETGKLRMPADVAPEIAQVISQMDTYAQAFVDLRV